jgi:hypothetical protein
MGQQGVYSVLLSSYICPKLSPPYLPASVLKYPKDSSSYSCLFAEANLFNSQPRTQAVHRCIANQASLKPEVVEANRVMSSLTLVASSVTTSPNTLWLAHARTCIYVVVLRASGAIINYQWRRYQPLHRDIDVVASNTEIDILAGACTLTSSKLRQRNCANTSLVSSMTFSVRPLRIRS